MHRGRRAALVRNSISGCSKQRVRQARRHKARHGYVTDFQPSFPQGAAMVMWHIVQIRWTFCLTLSAAPPIRTRLRPGAPHSMGRRAREGAWNDDTYRPVNV